MRTRFGFAEVLAESLTDDCSASEREAAIAGRVARATDPDEIVQVSQSINVSLLVPCYRIVYVYAREARILEYLSKVIGDNG